MFFQLENKNYYNSKSKYINAKIVFLRKRGASKYIAVLCTDTNARDVDIVKIMHIDVI